MSANVDKAQQVRPPIDVYSFDIASGATIAIGIPGDPMGITGTPVPPDERGKHTMLTNFISLQWRALTDLVTPVPPQQTDLYYRFSADSSGVVDSAAVVLPVDYLDPSPGTESALPLPDGATVRYDMSQLFQHGAEPARNPIHYLLVRTNVDGRLTFWRSSGR